MGLMIDTEYVYDFPEMERGKAALLRRDMESKTIGFSGRMGEIEIVPIEVTLPSDSIFRRGPLRFSDYQRGYEPVVLDPSGLQAAAAEIDFREIYIDKYHLPIASDGHIRIPIELTPLRSQFKSAAGIISGLTGPLQESWLLTLGLTRTIIRFPGSGNNDIPHCDFPFSKTHDGVGLKTKKAGLLPQIAVISSTITGTDFYPHLALTDIIDYSESHPRIFPDEKLRGLGKQLPVTKVPAEHNALLTDLHVHAGPKVDEKDAPLRDQFSWAEVEIEGDRAIRQTGMAVIRDAFHLVCERR